MLKNLGTPAAPSSGSTAFLTKAPETKLSSPGSALKSTRPF